MKRTVSGLAVAALMVAAATQLRPAHARAPAAADVLRVCADPNNLPFSNDRGEGFENRLARLIARELHRKVEYTWWAQRRGFFRNTLNAGLCDVVMGVPADLEMALTTRPYYRSTYALIYRKNAGYQLRSLDDPELRRLRIGLHFIGDDYANPPPAEALARRGMVRNLVGYSLYGDYREPNPPARLIEAVTQGKIDTAIAWGPLAGYFALGHGLAVVPLRTPAGTAKPFEFSIALGVRKDDIALRDRLDRALAQQRGVIAQLLSQYGVPLIEESGPAR